MFRRCAMNPIYFRFVGAPASIIILIYCKTLFILGNNTESRYSPNAWARTRVLLNHLRSSKRLIEPILIAPLRREPVSDVIARIACPVTSEI